MKNVYLMPGMSANSRIFEKIKLTNSIKCYYLEWIQPKSNESIEEYALRFSKLITNKKPILIGVSFGGVLMQEVSKIIKVKKVIIISSIKTNAELPTHMKFGRVTKSYKLLPLKWIGDIEFLISFVFGPVVEKRIKLYKKYLTVRDKNYLNWCIRELIEWKHLKPLKNVVHIHGSKDLIFPSVFIKNYIEIVDGDHAMILKKAEFLNKKILDIINEN
ncbi:MAG: alpha/beta hydrolase [Flavobacteriaceae bacterium]